MSRAMVLAIVESGYEIAASEYDVTAHSTSAGVFVCDGSMCDDVTIGTIGDATMAMVDDATIGGATRGTAIFETIGLTTGATIVAIGDMTIGLAIVTIGGTIGNDVTMVMMGDATMATVDDATIGGDITMGDATIAATVYVRTTGAKLDDDDFELLAAMAMEATGAAQ